MHDGLPVGARTRVRPDLKTKDGKKSWAAGYYGEVIETRPGEVRVRFESCDFCTLPTRCQAVHWIKIDDLAIRSGLDVLFDMIPSHYIEKDG